MTILILYLAIALVILYNEVMDCYRLKGRMDMYSVAFALLWVVSIPFAIYTIWKELEDPECVECHNKESVGHKMSCSERYRK